jgi:hypothetical protein
MHLLPERTRWGIETVSRTVHNCGVFDISKMVSVAWLRALYSSNWPWRRTTESPAIAIAQIVTALGS